MSATNQAEPGIHLLLSRQAREKLTQRAAESGRDVAAVAAELIEQAVNRPTLEELLAPIQNDFAKSGLTEDEIMELGRRELESIRDEKSSRP